MKQRVRQFNNTRGKNLTSSCLQLDRSTKGNSYFQQQNSFGHSQSSAFLKKDKVPTCVNCVNRKMTMERREKQQNEREIKLNQKKQEGLINQEQLNKVSNQRAKMTRQVQRYNKKAAKKQLNSVQSDKSLDLFFAKQIEKRQRELKEIDIQVQHLRQQRQAQYRSDLHHQVEEQKARKKEEKMQKLKTKPEDSLIKVKSDNSYLQKYKKDLKRQIQQDKSRKQNEKKLQLKLNNQELQIAQNNFKQYSEYKQQKKHTANPEIFEQMKQKEKRIKKQKQQKRILKDKERDQQIKRDREEYQKTVQDQLKKMKNYANQLAHQVKQKRHEKERVKNEDTRESRTYLYAQQLVESRKQQCGECHHPVKQTYLTYC